MGQDHRKTTDQGKDKLNMIRESERQLQQKEIQRPRKRSKDGEEKPRKTLTTRLRKQEKHKRVHTLVGIGPRKMRRAECYYS